jgi:hypothetical protein
LYTFLSIIQTLAIVGIFVVGLLLLWQSYLGKAPEREKKALQDELRSRPTYAGPDPAEKARSSMTNNLQLLGTTAIQAGKQLLNVPSLNPQSEGKWDSIQQVLTTSRVVAYFGKGADELDLYELSSGYVLILGGGKLFIMQRYNLTGPESDQLTLEYDEAINQNDGIIKNFAGYSWKINGAAGNNPNRSSTEEATSFIQVLSSAANIRETGFISSFPPDLLDDTEHHSCNDIRAKSTGKIDGEEGVDVEIDPNNPLTMYAVRAGWKWLVFIGRQLTEPEKTAIQAA